jgi:outer membrane protein
MRALYFLLTACALNAQTSLPSLIESAHHNERIESYSQQSSAASLGYESAKYSYFPRIDGFGNASFVDRTGGFDAKQSYNAGLKGEFIVFDGFKRENLIDQNKALKNAAKHTLLAAKKEISLEVIKHYFELQNTLDEIETLSVMQDQLEAQLVRLEKFKSVGLASEDALMRMGSELSNVHYKMEDLRYQYEHQKSNLELMSNQVIGDLSPSEILPPKETKTQELDQLNALKYSRDAKVHEAQMRDAQNLPTLKLEDQYTINEYYNDPIAQMRVSQQNKFIASLTINLVDFSSASLSKQALIGTSASAKQ